MTPSPIHLGNRTIGPGEPVVVIAEIGINHEGNVEVCARMIEEAAKAGADAMKLQTVDPDENYAPGSESYNVYKDAGLSREETARMFALARSLGIEPFTTAGDLATLEWVDRLEPAAYKISSGLLTSLPVVRLTAQYGRTLLMSTGMAEIADIDDSIETARDSGATEIGVFQCTSLYPAPPETLNIATISWLEQRYDAPAGLSDHSLGTEAAALSVAAGARMIEKHFSLDPSQPGYDHFISLNPESFAEMVRQVRAAQIMLGGPEKVLTAAERDNAARFHRCLVARRDIVAGNLIEAEDIAVMRVESGRAGLAPKDYEYLIGEYAIRDLPRFDPFTEEFLRARAKPGSTPDGGRLSD